MTIRTGAWKVVAALFTVINLIGIGMAVAVREGPHAGVHVALALVGMYFTWRLGGRASPNSQSDAQLSDDRLEQLQQSIDAVALEVERIGEAQRFSAKLNAEQIEPRR